MRAFSAKLGVDPEFLLHREARKRVDWASVMPWIANLSFTAKSNVLAHHSIRGMSAHA